MVSTDTQTVTVDRISNSGNAIAKQQRDGKTIHVPAGEVGDTFDVRLVEKGGYIQAQLVNRAGEVQPRQPSVGPDTSDIASDLLDSESDSHSHKIRSSPAGGKLRSKADESTGRELRSRMPRRKK